MTALNNLSIRDIYRLVYEFVKHFPKQDVRCKRLQTFAILETMSDINATNLGKTWSEAQKTFFFSRAWAKENHSPSKIKFNYPAVLLFERQIPMLDPFGQKTEKHYCITLNFMDKYDRACVEKDQVSKDVCASRNISEIYLQAEDFISVFLAYMKEIIYITEDSRWVNRQVWTSEGSAGTIDEKSTRLFLKNLNDVNPETNMDRLDAGIDDTYGTSIDIKIKVNDCGLFVYSPEIQDFKIGADKSCC